MARNKKTSRVLMHVRVSITYLHLTHLSLVYLLCDIGKQNSLRCDAAVRGVTSGAIVCSQNFHRKIE